MKCRTVLKTIAALAGVLAISALFTCAFAGGSAQQPLNASYAMTYVEKDGPYYIWSGEGNGSVVGNSSYLTAIKVTGDRAEGVHTITVANGDSLVLTSTWTFGKTTDHTWSGTFTITGGTGRFANASGSGTTARTLNSDGTVITTLAGTISL